MRLSHRPLSLCPGLGSAQTSARLEKDDRRAAGHWEDDLIVGKNRQPAHGTLVARQTRMVRLLQLLHPTCPGLTLALSTQPPKGANLARGSSVHLLAVAKWFSVPRASASTLLFQR